MNDEIRMTRASPRSLIRHLSIPASFVIRHFSSFVLRDFSHEFVSNAYDDKFAESAHISKWKSYSAAVGLPRRVNSAF